jgi:hypothetical protein
MAATMLPRPTALIATPLGGSDCHAPHSDQDSVAHCVPTKTALSGASDAAVARSQTGKGTQGQGIGNNAHANTVATKAEDAAAQAPAKELKTMRADQAKAQREADTRYAGFRRTRAFDALKDKIRSGGRAV